MDCSLFGEFLTVLEGNEQLHVRNFSQTYSQP